MHTERKPRTALWAIGGFAIAGLIHLGAGMYWDDSRITIMGAGALVFGLVLGLATEAFRLRANQSPAAAVPVAASTGRAIEYNYVDEVADATPAPTSTPRARDPSQPTRLPFGLGMDLQNPDEDLVDFELVEEKQLPTKLVVPSAFENVPPTVQREVTVTTGAAMQRRKEMVSGLPLVASILADEPPAATQVVPPANAGKSRGQCSACGTMLWAPAQRPLRLRCPRCGHVRTLTA